MLTTAATQHYEVYLACRLPFRHGKEPLMVPHITAVSGSTQTHSKSPTPPKQLRHPENCGGSFGVTTNHLF